MTDFIREVDEDLRQERVRRALTRFWYVPIIVVVLVLGGVGVWRFYDYTATQKAETAGGQYLDALDQLRDNKADEAVKTLQGVEATGTPGYRLLARLRLAGELGAKDPQAGAQAFDAIAADASVDPAIQSVAKLRAGLLLVDKLPYAELKTRLDPLADANSPLRNAAREMLALAALKAGQNADAGHYLDAIETDPATSGSLRQRAETLSGLVRGAGEAPATSAPAPAAVPTATPTPAPAPTSPAETPAPDKPAPDKPAP